MTANLYIQIRYFSTTKPHLSGSYYLISANSEFCDCAMQLPHGTLYVCLHVCPPSVSGTTPLPPMLLIMS